MNSAPVLWFLVQVAIGLFAVGLALLALLVLYAWLVGWAKHGRTR